MSDTKLDLDAIEARGRVAAKHQWGLTADDVLRNDVPALVAEVRRLESQVEAVDAELRAFNRCPCWSGSLCNRCSVRLARLITQAEGRAALKPSAAKAEASPVVCLECKGTRGNHHPACDTPYLKSAAKETT